MEIRRITKAIKTKLRYGFIVEWYNFWYLALRKKHHIVPKIASIDNTIDKIIQSHCSISRFGDGEILLLSDKNKSIGFQEANSMLSQKLKEVILSNDPTHLVCLSDTFEDLHRYNRKAKRFWRTHFFLYQWVWEKYIDKDKLYYNTFVTRPYMDFADKTKSKDWFTNMKEIWKNRDVVFIEGEKSRLGVGNDFFDHAKSIKRILCPPQNAFNRYDDIIKEAVKQNRDVLFLIALGPTATALAYDLHKAGYQAIDAGHVDIEYEWWRMKAKRKVKIPQKYVNEAVGGEIVTNAGMEYQNQIIAKIL